MKPGVLALILFGLLLAWSPLASAVEEAPPQGGELRQGFEEPTALADWECQGDVTVMNDLAFKGSGSLRLARTLERVEEPTGLSSPALAARAGTWAVSGALAADIFSPDSSYKVQVMVRWAAGDGGLLASDEIASVSGKQSWQPFRKQIEAPEGAATARLVIVLDKAHGVCHVDDLALVFVSEQSRKLQLIERFTYASPSFCNLIEPGLQPVFTVTVEAFQPLSSEQRGLSWQLRDYWGAEMAAPGALTLVDCGQNLRGRYVYRALVDLGPIALEQGKYYELHTAVALPGMETAQDRTTFAILPPAPSRNHPPESIPFTSRNWDNRFDEHPLLSDRIGQRTCGLWAGFTKDAPDKPFAPQLENAERLGMQMLTGVPSWDIENHRPGWEQWTEEKMRLGVRTMLEKYAARGMRKFSLGNEPPGLEERAREAVPFYKAAYEEIKKFDPTIQVIGTAIGPVEEYFKAGFQDYQDVYDFHVYEDVQAIRKVFARYRELFDKYGCEKPITSTEIGLNAQGIPRLTIAGDLIRKVSVFFALGGLHVSWFDLFYPDPEGVITGSNGDAFNAFNCKYRCYSPRLDALAYYNMINGILVKQCLGEKLYENGVLATLFRDDEGACFMTLSNELARQDFFLPLPGTDQVKVLRIDGSSVLLDAGKQGLTLGVGVDPVLLSWQGGAAALPEALGAPVASLLDVPAGVVKGNAVELRVALKALAPQDLALHAPMGWQVGEMVVEQADGTAIASWSLRSPQQTGAREARMVLALGKVGEIAFGIPVTSVVSMEVLPLVQRADGVAGVKIVARNNGGEAQTVATKVELLGEFLMDRNNYELTELKPAGAFFTDVPEATLEIAPGAEATFVVELQGLDAQTIYKVKAVATDAAGIPLSQERMLAGFVNVPRAASAPTLDGVLDEAEWQRARPLPMNEERQFWGYGDRVWRGVEDLSGSMRVLWDDQYLYVGVMVVDDVFRHEKADSEIWAGDGLQFLFDPCRAMAEKVGKYDYSVGVGTKGPQVWCTYSADPAAPSGLIPSVRFVAKRLDETSGAMCYELAFPWARLAPFAPAAGGNFGFAVIINDDDGIGRDCYIGWYSGVSTKMIDVVGDFVLGE